MKTKISFIAGSVILLILIIVSCRKDEINVGSKNTYSAIPQLPENPHNYNMSGNDHLAALGRVLFYDKNLSLNNSVSCASCHQQSKAFCDNQQFSTGLEDVKTPRNSPSIFARSSRMFWDGRAFSLKDLVLRPIKNHVEMKFENLDALTKKISSINYYTPLFQKAFPQKINIDSTMVQDALAEFLLNFDFSNNKFNKSINDPHVLSASEKLGETIFFGKGKCFNCHHIQGNQGFFPGDTIQGGYGSTDQEHNIGLDVVYADNGIGDFLNDKSRNGKFLIPVLLNIEYTAPYMHDGRFKTLEEVVEHYNSGIQDHPNLDFTLRDFSQFQNLTNKEIFDRFDTNHDGMIGEDEMPQVPPIRLGLSPSEKKGLVDFLKTLSDPSIFTQDKFSDPFVAK